MDRRQFLSTSGAALGLGLVTSGSPAAVLAQTSAKGSSDVALNALFEEIFKEQVADSPEQATSLGLDKGPNAALKSKLDTDPGPVSRQKDLARNKKALARLKAVGTGNLSDAAKLNREVVTYSLETAIAAPSRWNIDSS